MNKQLKDECLYAHFSRETTLNKVGVILMKYQSRALFTLYVVGVVAERTRGQLYIKVT